MSDVAVTCTSCGTELAASLVSCPSCHALVYRERLEQLARDADVAVAAKDFVSAARLWREALALVPAGTKQHQIIAARAAEATEAAGQPVANASTKPKTFWAKVFGPIGVVLVALVTKAKLLLLGLTKMSTLISMLAFVGVYWAAWGWKFAVAVVAAIYIHEMGHVASLTRRGMRAAAPLFLPGIGAFVRLHERPINPSEDARIGLAGPAWGLGASLIALAGWRVTGSPFWLAVAFTTAWINLFNLLPVWQLDGSRGFQALTPLHRWICVALIAAAWVVTREGLLILLGAAAIWRALQKTQSATENDWGALAGYAGLLAAFSAFMVLPHR